MTRKTLLTLAVLTALSAGTALAATAPASETRQSARPTLDVNGDGAIDRAEAARSERLGAKFDELDKNKDGKLTKEEMPRRDSHRGGKRHGAGGWDTRLDTDKDGRVSRAEWAAGESRKAGRFELMDANKDGFVDRADHQLRSKQRTDAWFAKADSDKDGKLSREELTAYKAAHHGPRGEHGDRGPRTDVKGEAHL